MASDAGERSPSHDGERRGRRQHRPSPSEWGRHGRAESSREQRRAVQSGRATRAGSMNEWMRMSPWMSG
jgi:hypothetical protein